MKTIKRNLATLVSGIFLLSAFAPAALAHEVETETTSTTRVKVEKVFNLEEAKAKALAHLEKVETQLKKALEKIKANEKIDAAVKAKITANMELHLGKIAEVKVKVQAATTREELLKVHHDVRKDIHRGAKIVREKLEKRFEKKGARPFEKLLRHRLNK